VELLASEDLDPSEAERRIATRREALEGEIERLEAKLANERFVERAPGEVVQGERDKLVEYRSSLARLRG
jgi:valyl-tRNA synthetase